MCPGNIQVHFSSKSDEWETPQDLFDELNAEFNFTVDVCATHDNTKVPGNCYTVEDDGLSRPWVGTAWANFPYSEAEHWITKGYESSREGSLVVMLAAARPDTAWFRLCLEAGEIRYRRGRLRFGNAKTYAPMPSCLVVFHPRDPQVWPPAHELMARLMPKTSADRWFRAPSASGSVR